MDPMEDEVLVVEHSAESMGDIDVTREQGWPAAPIEIPLEKMEPGEARVLRIMAEVFEGQEATSREVVGEARTVPHQRYAALHSDYDYLQG